VLSDLSPPPDDRVLVDYRTSDDAGVYRWDDSSALVQTVDFFTPIVDDPFAYGQIAAANSLSDVYAMGGVPLTALAVAGFPIDELEPGVIQSIFKGGLSKLREAGVALLGGHTVKDAEIKFGYSVTGRIDPDRVLSNAGLQAGDALLLTKPIGTGIVATAIKRARAPEAVAANAIGSMATLNRAPADALRALPAGEVHACTDITGFGLVGHVCEMASASGVGVRIDSATVPLLEGATALVGRHQTAGGDTNAQHFGERTEIAGNVSTDLVALLHDPQTSGGLLVAVAATALDRAVAALAEAGVNGVTIGEAVPVQDASALVSIT
jgi:selenide,water dikinase|tara:strand:- start:1435 stop:2406 length:972 start_codon:yes stop_codon:yes gene_type:complete